LKRIVWGAAEIGKAIGQDAKFVYYHQSAGHFKSIRKVGRLLVADIDALLAEIVGESKEDAA
jgi:hypothetical protein